MTSRQRDYALYRGSAPFTVSKTRATPQHRLDPHLDGRLLCHCRSHVSSPFWPPEDVVQGVPFANEEDDDTGHDYLCPKTQTPVRPIITQPSNLYPQDIPQQVVVFPPLFTRKVGARLSLFCDVWRRRCSEWVCSVLEVGFRLWFRECPPLTSTPSAFVDKGSIMKRTTLRSLVQSMQQKNIVEVVRDTTSPGCYSHLFLVPKKSGGWRPVIDLSFLNSFLEIPHFTVESAESNRRSLPRWVTSIDLVDAYFDIPIHRGYRKFLRFQTWDRIYQFRALASGLSPAPWVFTKIMTEIKMLVHMMGINLCQ